MKNNFFKGMKIRDLLKKAKVSGTGTFAYLQVSGDWQMFLNAGVMRILLFSFVLFSSCLCWSQNKNDEVIFFGVVCGYGAQTSEEINTFKHLNDQADYSTIREKLFEASPIEQVLSAILLEHYLSTKTLEITEQEKKKIEEISKSKARFRICHTCLYSEKGTLKQFFSEKDQFNYKLVKRAMLSDL